VTQPSAPTPTSRAIARFSPTLVEAVTACALRAAFLQDPAFRGLRRPNPSSLLGQAAHRLIEDAVRGRFDVISVESLRGTLEEAWDAEVATAARRLAAAWTVAAPPPPRDWTGYELTHVRLVRRLARLVEQRRSRVSTLTSRGESAVVAERSLEDPTTGLHGRPDRVERLSSRTCVVDLKAGWTQQPEIRATQRRQLLLYAYLVYRDTGRWPDDMAIEDASGRRATDPVHPEEAIAALEEAVQAIQRFNSAVGSGQSPLSLATPSPESCRYCPFRAVCGPYWNAVRIDWPMLPSMLGEITATSPAFGRVQLVAAQPSFRIGSTITVLGVAQAALPKLGEFVGVIDAYATGRDGEFQARWATQLEPWDGTAEHADAELAKS
jgi:hypothetical protein